MTESGATPMREANVLSLAERLRDRRAQLGISQAQAARELDVARTAYRLWELEVAKPAPDRWRLIARWLGVSMTTLLVAEEMMSEDEASTHAPAAAQLEVVTAPQPDVGTAQADFFVEAQAQLDEGIARGDITTDDAKALGRILERMEHGRARDGTAVWETAELRKSLSPESNAPDAAAAAIDVVGEGLPDRQLEDARRLTSALVAHSIRRGSPATGLAVSVGRDVIRVEITDLSNDNPVTQIDGVRLDLLSGAANRWGGERSDEQHVTWFEIDVPAPGA